MKTKLLSVRQPWATAIVLGTKRIEVRSRATHYRGPLAIRASGHITRSLIDALAEDDQLYRAVKSLTWGVEDADVLDPDTGFDNLVRAALPVGVVIGGVYLRDCSPLGELFRTRKRWAKADQVFSFDALEYMRKGQALYGYVLEKPFMLRKPVRAPGLLGITDWSVPRSASELLRSLRKL